MAARVCWDVDAAEPRPQLAYPYLFTEIKKIKK